MIDNRTSPSGRRIETIVDSIGEIRELVQNPPEIVWVRGGYGYDRYLFSGQVDNGVSVIVVGEFVFIERPSIATYYEQNWLVSDWYIDAVTGDNNNSGISPDAPLRTGSELLARLGPRAQWNHSVVIHVGVGGCADVLTIQGATTAANCSVDVVGSVVTSVAAGTVATYSGIDHVTPRAPQLTTTGIADWTPYVKSRLRIVGGANDGAVTWVAKANPHGLGVNFARTSAWYKRTNVTASANLYAAVVPAVGDTVVIETLPVVASLAVDIGGVVNSVLASPSWPLRQMTVDSIQSPILIHGATGDFVQARSLVFGCRFGQCVNMNEPSVSSTFRQDRVACLFDAGASSVRVSGVYIGCQFNSVTQTAAATTGMILVNQSLFQGSTFSAQIGLCSCSDIQFFDCANAGLTCLTIASGNAQNVSGVDNAGYAYGWVNRISVRLPGTQNLTAATGIHRFLTAPNLTLTAAQFTLPWLDGARQGTATIGATGAGFVDVAIPYLDVAIQKVIAFPRDLLGVPGFLSAPVANRTAAGFRLQSNNVGDVSTVDWQTTPLGRNIFVTA